MDVTLFEFHLSDAEFNAPFSRRAGADGPSAERTPAPDGRPSARVGPLAALLALVGLALLARYLRGGEADRTTADEPEA